MTKDRRAAGRVGSSVVFDVGARRLTLQAAGAWLGFRLAQHVRALMWAESALYGYLYQRY